MTEYKLAAVGEHTVCTIPQRCAEVCGRYMLACMLPCVGLRPRWRQGVDGWWLAEGGARCVCWLLTWWCVVRGLPGPGAPPGGGMGVDYDADGEMCGELWVHAEHGGLAWGMLAWVMVA